MHIIITIILAILIILSVVWFLVKRRRAIKQVKCLSEEAKLRLVNAALKPFGFVFDYCQDIVISQDDPWQKDLGYTDLYDLKAPFLNMVFDAEPICFEYNCKQYRVEFWKGQYGITTGAEVGVYVRDHNTHMPITFYRAASCDEQLDITFKLTKKCDLFSRCGKSWWLTGFDVGLFSRPRDLMMSVCIVFPDECMQEAFLKALVNAGYSKTNICVCKNSVCFEYCCSKNYKLNKKYRLIKCVAQIFNYINCHIYNFITRFFSRTLDKLTYLRFLSPCLYRLIIRISLPRRKKKHFHKRVLKNKSV